MMPAATEDYRFFLLVGESLRASALESTARLLLCSIKHHRFLCTNRVQVSCLTPTRATDVRDIICFALNDEVGCRADTMEG
jgi:hypothetical protein